MQAHDTTDLDALIHTIPPEVDALLAGASALRAIEADATEAGDTNTALLAGLLIRWGWIGERR